MEHCIFYLSGPIPERLNVIVFQDQLNIILIRCCGAPESAWPTGHGPVGLLGNATLPTRRDATKQLRGVGSCSVNRAYLTGRLYVSSALQSSASVCDNSATRRPPCNQRCGCWRRFAAGKSNFFDFLEVQWLHAAHKRSKYDNLAV